MEVIDIYNLSIKKLDKLLCQKKDSDIRKLVLLNNLKNEIYVQYEIKVNINKEEKWFDSILNNLTQYHLF
jgi:hypothetical protein